ncbi:hypothetical protein HAX54_048294 [Datura stramonium]|uniref:O-methyltransferase C-terminal domain-containing protein n=1 Tax=Datura stramonium TaxID=4076 RepID=A0ABS8STZ2_DATST|nr:hypothetical protein [Datura stramonium]
MATSESTSTELLHAQAQIWNYIFNFISSSASVFSKAWSELSAWFQNDSPPLFHTAHGKSFWDYIEEEEPKILSDIFNDALASDSRLNTNVLVMECKHVFEGLTSLVDVGDLKGRGIWNVGGDMFDKFPMLMPSYSVRSARLEG